LGRREDMGFGGRMFVVGWSMSQIYCDRVCW
jgi:hypothetical protein